MHLICLHNVVAGPIDAFDEKCSRISVSEFERFLDAVAGRFELVSYSDYVERLKRGDDADIVALSFDDGFLGVFDHARPALAARGLDAVAFINPPYLGNPAGRIFHFLELEIAFRLTTEPHLRLSFADEAFDLSETRPRVKALKRVKKLLKTRPEPERVAGRAETLAALGVPEGDILAYARAHPQFRIMDARQVSALRDSGWTIGSHTMTHRTLSMLPPADLESEIGASRRYFEETFGWTDLPFAYPYGDRIHVGDDAPQAVARAGHPMAFTTVPGPSDLAGAPHSLPRIDYKRFVRDCCSP